MEIKEVKISELRPAEYNPREKSEHVITAVRQSIKEYGFLQPVVINTHECERCGNRKNIIVGGHRRIEAAAAEGLETVPAVFVNLHINDEKRANLRLNAQEKFQREQLAELITELNNLDAEQAGKLGFSADEIIKLLFEARYQNPNKKINNILKEKFLIPPFSVFDAKQGYWQKRKAQWIDLLGDLAETRETKLAGSENNLLMRGINSGVSIFDPVVSEVIFLWFLPEGGKILDPFAGSLARGGVAAALGFDYTGIEIRKEQIETNEKKLTELGLKARYIHADANDLNKVISPDEKFDLIFSSPPYYDLEIYSEHEKDISTKKTYDEFMKDYESIFKQATSHLNENRFVILELGDIRDERGFYRNFLGDNISLFKKLGFELYNEIIYLQMLATAPHRAERNMRKRKVVKTHQNIYTFYRGDPDFLKNPRLLEVHQKVLAFFKGDPEKIKDEFKNPPPISRDIITQLIDID
ncbi:MAG: hypothetical protein KatS3mg101_1086 [Patescibacteria group bacterium]|nr:MAG: hypothetical protein KatS3mg101_1086 [Patescibacteria group bacterium]